MKTKFNNIFLIVLIIMIIYFNYLDNPYNTVFFYIPVILKIVFILVLFYLCGYFLSRKMAISKYNFKKYRDYYRDIISTNSPSNLLLIYDLKFDYDKTVVVSLLYLKMKKYIEIKDDKIIKIETGADLNCTLKLVFDSISNNSVILDNELLKKAVEEEAVTLSLVKSSKYIEDSVFKNRIFIFLAKIFCLIPFIIGSMIIILSFILPNFASKYSLYSLVFVFIGLIASYSFITFILGTSKATDDYPFIRTKDGDIIKKKLDGLKTFIDKFGEFSQKKSEELILWEDYLIYSVIFDLNKQIPTEYKKYINNKI